MSFAAWLCSSTERLFRSRAGMGIATPSPVQLAWCRLLDGEPLGDVIDDPQVLACFGGTLPPAARPEEVCLFGGIRGGKTALIAATAIRCSQTVDCSPMMRGETFRIPIVSLTRDLAKQTFAHLRNAIEGSEVLSRLLVKKPATESLEVRHPSGHVCEIAVTAGAAAGASTAARFLGAAIFDEFPRMLGAEDGVVNWDDMRGECKGRILDGGIILNAGSPWAPYGPAYELFVERFGVPSSEMVVAKAKAQWLNPSWWTEARVAKYKAAPGNADKAETNIEANFAAQQENLFSTIELARIRRDLPLTIPYDERQEYIAAMDPGMKGNSWTLTIFTRLGGKLVQVLAEQWTGTKSDPLKPSIVLGGPDRDGNAGIVARLREYRIRTCLTDQYHAESLRDLAEPFGVALIPILLSEKEKTEGYLALYHRCAEEQVQLAPDPWVIADLQRLKKITTQTGVRIELVKTSDGRHCDYAPCILLAAKRYLHEPMPERPPTGSHEALELEEKRIKASLVREAKRKRVADGRH
jgi:hypothetical protein